MTQADFLLKIASQYGVKGINFGGCIEGQSQGFKGAMRRSAHAHCHKKYSYHGYYGWICVKSSHIEKLLSSNGRPNHLFWHEVSHIYRPSRTQKACDDWASEMLKLDRAEQRRTPQDAFLEPTLTPAPSEIKKLKFQKVQARLLLTTQQRIKFYKTRLKRDTNLLKKYERKLTKLEKSMLKGGEK